MLGGEPHPSSILGGGREHSWPSCTPTCLQPLFLASAQRATCWPSGFVDNPGRRQRDGPDVPPGIPHLPITRQTFYDSIVWGRQSCCKSAYGNIYNLSFYKMYLFYFEIPETALCPQTCLWNSLASSVY